MENEIKKYAMELIATPLLESIILNKAKESGFEENEIFSMVKKIKSDLDTRIDLCKSFIKQKEIINKNTKIQLKNLYNESSIFGIGMKTINRFSNLQKKLIKNQITEEFFQEEITKILIKGNK